MVLSWGGAGKLGVFKDWVSGDVVNAIGRKSQIIISIWASLFLTSVPLCLSLYVSISLSISLFLPLSSTLSECACVMCVFSIFFSFCLGVFRRMGWIVPYIYSSEWAQNLHAAHSGLKLVILLSQSPECWALQACATIPSWHLSCYLCSETFS